MNAGNDDPAPIDAVLLASEWVQFLEGRVVTLPDGTEVASCGYANRTPGIALAMSRRTSSRAGWKGSSPCSRSQEGGLQLPLPAVRHRHRLRPQAGRGVSDDVRGRGRRDAPVGSTACRAAIERYQPLLGLHGHLHESRGVHKLGRTICLNPGSEYNEGILRGALVELRRGSSAAISSRPASS